MAKRVIESAEIAKLEQGETFVGKYLGARTVETEVGESTLHEFQTKDGKRGIWGSAQLNDMLRQVEPGTEGVEVTWVSTREPKKKGHNAMKVYKVEVDE